MDRDENDASQLWKALISETREVARRIEERVCTALGNASPPPADGAPAPELTQDGAWGEAGGGIRLAPRDG